MYERGHSGAAGQQALRETLRRLEAVLARQQQQLRELRDGEHVPGKELLARTAKLLSEEIDRVRRLLA